MPLLPSGKFVPARLMGFVFQSFDLVPALTARQQMEPPLRLAGQALDRAAADRVPAAVGLAGRSRHRAAEHLPYHVPANPATPSPG
ncbi:hypothetical protein ACIQWA_40490 [Kitasatospora sp. NPDC098652]|uniref:hypothetical protein n=1 Tax=Kitasatospora sp. NPDC098652 TaxID=3364095 RepID=UPI003812BCE4